MVQTMTEGDVGAMRTMPTWPMTLLFGAFPLFWLLGLGSVVWILLGAVMALVLWQTPGVRAPRGFGLWLFFLLWMLMSGSQIDTVGRGLGFALRAAQYLSCTAIFLYAYNLRPHVPVRYFLGVLTAFFAGVVAGGYLGVVFPDLTIPTPMSAVVPASLQANDLVRDMVVLRTTQYRADAFAQFDPRPSAPFLYTNNWGNLYSFLLPVVAAYFLAIRSTAGRVAVGALMLVSVVPAVLTLNRGMYVGLAVVLVVVSVRLALRGQLRALLMLVVLAVPTYAILQALAVSERLNNRLESSGTNDSRLTVYSETIRRTTDSPWFGFGGPRPAIAAGVPAAGTQGQLWMLLFSFGFLGVAMYLAWWLTVVVKTVRQPDATGLLLNAVLVALLVETLYYGMLPHGIAVAMVVAAVALKPNASGSPPSQSELDETRAQGHLERSEPAPADDTLDEMAVGRPRSQDVGR